MESEAIQAPCSYCNRCTAAPIQVLLTEIAYAAFSGFTDVANELPHESKEGGYIGETLQAWEVIWSLGSWTGNEDLQDDVEQAFADTLWCKENYFSLDQKERLRYGWQSFVRQVKHKTRYLFLQELEDKGQDEIPPGRMLDEINGLLKGLVSELPKDSVLYRVRVVKDGERPCTASEMGTPPPGLATIDNRMSPAGIPMFYAAQDEKTAVVETFDPSMESGRMLAIDEWQVNRDLALLDLTDLPEIPDPFDHENRWQAERINFVYKFVDELTRPVSRRSGSLEYIPTQIVSEHIRCRMRTNQGKLIDGIRYRSSRRDKGTVIVVFAQQENCGPPSGKQGWLLDEQLVTLTDVRYLDSFQLQGSFN